MVEIFWLFIGSLILMLILILTLILIKAKKQQRKSNGGKNIVVILGSGGHTTQMCEMLRKFRFKDCRQFTVITGNSDLISQSFFMNYFQEFYKSQGNQFPKQNLRMLKTARTNNVHQTKLTSIFTTLYALLAATKLIIIELLATTHMIANGPGICVPFFCIFWLLNKLKITKVELIFVESWCRVKSMSLTGKIVRYFTSRYITHWDTPLKFAQYHGKIL